MSKIDKDSLLGLWLTGDLDLTEQLYADPLPHPEETEKYQPSHDPAAAAKVTRYFRRFYNICAALLCMIFAAIMLLTVANLPPYGAKDAPTVNEVAQRYVEKGTEETGAVNTVAGMILDYRAFDTLGESFVLFTAMCAVTVLMNQSGKRRRVCVEAETVDYYADPIVRTMCKFVIPVILVFGIYILLNGHLSPGGGFSGGAILASAFIIFAMVWGDERAQGTIRVPVIKTITLCALCFYALSKTYSFFTGANHLHSVISPGVPGRILSAGLILPLNVAVGVVVCCTMYSFYMYFKRGEL
ncbi:MAG: MnhB domain-containing protein [Eubacteriales bacterium]|nr:MnhB domain-containing protein [Eubacteriales bacterium]